MEETNRKIQVHVNTQVYFFNRPGKRIMAVAQQGCTGFRFDTMLRPAAAVWPQVEDIITGERTLPWKKNL